MTAPAEVGSHVSWCDGTHDRYGECIHVVEWRDSCNDRATATVVAVPCDSAYIELDGGGLYRIADVDRQVEALTTLRPLLEAARVEADCTGHTHIDG